MIPRYGRPVPQYSIISSHILDDLYTRFSYLLESFDLPFLQSHMLEMYCRAIYNKGAALGNCFGFIDGTVRPVCRPGGRMQRLIYNGHKRVHASKFQSTAIPNGIIANLYGPVEGKRRDSRMLAMSGLLPKLQTYAFDPNGITLFIRRPCLPT